MELLIKNENGQVDRFPPLFYAHVRAGTHVHNNIYMYLSTCPK